jgi:hypothetical protein
MNLHDADNLYTKYSVVNKKNTQDVHLVDKLDKTIEINEFI